MQAKNADQLAVQEGRRHHGDVVQVAGALPGIVGDVGVALEHIVARDFVDEMQHGLGHGVHMAGRAGHRLRQHLAARVEHAGRQVAASRTEVEKAVRSRVSACSSTTEINRFHITCMRISPNVAHACCLCGSAGWRRRSG